MRNIPFVLFLLLLPLMPLSGQTDSSELYGKASFYHDSFDGRITSNGEEYDKEDFTAAHRTFPFNTLLLVSNKNNNRSVIVRVNDRGPFAKSRIIDLSKSAAIKLKMVQFGVVPVKIEIMTYLDALPMNDSLFVEGDFWDCYGNKVYLSKKGIRIWSTKDWKHAFYMASSISLDLKLENVAVFVKGPIHKRRYIVVVTDCYNKMKGIEWMNVLRTNGYMNTRIISASSQL